MSALRALIFAMLAFACAPLAAQSDKAEKAQAPVRYAQGNSAWRTSDEAATKSFWRFMSCISEKSVDETDFFLFTDLDDRDAYIAGRKLTRENRKCLDSGTNRLSTNLMMIEGALGGLRLSERYKSSGMPDYSSVPNIYSATRYAALEDDEAKRRYLMLMFGECVVRTDPASVFGLMKTDLYSKDASPFWSALSETMSYCIPAQDGDALALKTFELRIYFGRAALALEHARMGILDSVKEASE